MKHDLSLLFIANICISQCLSYFDLAADYYTDIRRKIPGAGDEEVDIESVNAADAESVNTVEADSVHATVDVRMILRIVNDISDDEALEFRSIFKFFFQQPLNDLFYEGPYLDCKAELKAILVCFSIALMNVNDTEGDEKKELIPFLEALRTEKDEYGKFCFDQSLRVFAWILFGISESKVSYFYGC